MVLKRARWAKPDIERAVKEVQLSDEVLRGSAVSAFCPAVPAGLRLKNT
jgi:hypothetical protein